MQRRPGEVRCLNVLKSRSGSTQPTKHQLRSGRYRSIGGIWHKLCSGPAHEKPEWLPATDKYFYIQQSEGREGKPTAHCRLCKHWSKLKNPGSHRGMVKISAVRPFYLELANRIGVMEIHRRSGVSLGHIERVIHNKNHAGEVRTDATVRKEMARRVMLELVSAQRRDEHSISPYSKWRQEKRHMQGLNTCKGCGIHVERFSIGCKICYERGRSRFISGLMTEAQWEEAKVAMRDDIKNQERTSYLKAKRPTSLRKRLTAKQKTEIRKSYIPKVVTLSDLAKKYKVAESTIHRAVHGT